MTKNHQSTDAFDTLAQLGADPESGVYLNQPCDETVLQQLQLDAIRAFGEEVPEGFVRFLRITNGIQINGAYFKEAENLVTENLDFLLPEVIILGTAGNQAQFVFDKRDRNYHTFNIGDDPSARFESYNTFEDMLFGIMKEQQVL